MSGARPLVVLWVGVLMAPGWSQAADRPMVERRFDFRKGQFDNVQLRPIGEGTARLLQPGPDGLRVRIPAGSGPDRVGFKPQWTIEGDFEITASFEVVRADKPDKGYGVGPGLHLMFKSPGEDAATLSRLVRVKEGEVFGAHYATSDDPKNPKQRNRRVKLSPASERSGKLRLVRTGDSLRYFVVDGNGDDFREIDQGPVVTGPVAQIWFVVNRHGASTGTEVVWKDVTVRAEVFRDPEVRGRGGQIAILAAVLAALLVVPAGVWYWRARKARAAKG